MKLLFLTSEASPFAKTGGLGDVAGALPAALANKRVSTRAMMPLYDKISDEFRSQMKFLGARTINLGWREAYCGLFELKHRGVTWYFIDNEYYFKRGELYGHFDDGERYAFFSRAAAELAQGLPDWRPDVIHCNDWQTALVPVYLRDHFAGEADDIRTVFTIHNIEYQGRYSRDLLGDLFALPDRWFNGGTMEFKGGLNLMKAGIEMADWVTTVSPSYAEELGYSFYAHGMEGVISACRHKISGILNGIDMEVYDPETDPHLFKNYSAEMPAGKQENKVQLQKLLGLAPRKNTPLVAMVTRLVGHKGLDLVAASLEAMMDIDVQFALIGQGEWHFEQLLLNAEETYKGRFSASLMYNAALAQKLYAGADIFLMPSLSEPCGLAQMIAMRYGTLPLVRETGGLKDTVTPYIAESGTGRGFTFTNYNADDMQYVLKQAVALYQKEPKKFKAMQAADMKLDFSWSASAGEYMKIYRNISGKR